MSHTLRLWYRVEDIESGESVLDIGSVEYGRPYSEVTSSTASAQRGRKVVLAAGEVKTLWDWDVDGDFTLLGVTSNGYAWLSMNVDKATSSTDNNDAGTADNYPKEAISNVAPRFFQSMLAPVNTSAANYAGSAFHAGTEQGRCYKLEAKNPGTTSVTIEVFWR